MVARFHTDYAHNFPVLNSSGRFGGGVMLEECCVRETLEESGVVVE